MSQYIIQKETLKGIADAIRSKTGSSNPIKVSDMANEIEDIPSGGGVGGSIYVETRDGITFKDSSGNDIILSNSDFDIFIRYYDKSTSATHVIFGSHNSARYYENISLEIQNSGTSVWLGISSNGTSWNTVSNSTELSQYATFPSWYNLSIILKNNVITFNIFEEVDGSPVKIFDKSYTLSAGLTINRTAFTFGGNARMSSGIPFYFDSNASYIYNDGVRVF